MRMYLFGYLTDDFFGRVIVAPADLTVRSLADQLTAWGPTPERRGSVTVTNEVGVALDPALTIGEAGFRNGDIFTVDHTVDRVE
jgi:hypothetical protein